MKQSELNTFDVFHKGRRIDVWTTPTCDVDRATAEAIDMLGLPPQATLVLRTKKRSVQ